MLETSTIWRGEEVSLTIDFEHNDDDVDGVICVADKFYFRSRFELCRTHPGNWGWGNDYWRMTEKNARFVSNGNTGLLPCVTEGLKAFGRGVFLTRKPHGIILTGDDQKRCDWNHKHFQDLLIPGYAMQAHWRINELGEELPAGLVWTVNPRQNTIKWSLNSHRIKTWSLLRDIHREPKELKQFAMV